MTETRKVTLPNGQSHAVDPVGNLAIDLNCPKCCEMKGYKHTSLESPKRPSEQIRERVEELYKSQEGAHPKYGVRPFDTCWQQAVGEYLDQQAGFPKSDVIGGLTWGWGFISRTSNPRENKC